MLYLAGPVERNFVPARFLPAREASHQFKSRHGEFFRSPEEVCNQMKHPARFRRGQTAVILTLALPTLIATIAFGTDIGVLYFNWLQLQKSADAAVLAGAVYLPSNPAVAISTADFCAHQRGLEAAEITSTRVGADDRTLTISVSRKVHLLTSVLGFGAPHVAVNATAQIVGAHSPGGVDTRFIQASVDVQMRQTNSLIA
jgi:Flp pilus assembly protein TadG